MPTKSLLILFVLFTSAGCVDPTSSCPPTPTEDLQPIDGEISFRALPGVFMAPPEVLASSPGQPGDDLRLAVHSVDYEGEVDVEDIVSGGIMYRVVTDLDMPIAEVVTDCTLSEVRGGGPDPIDIRAVALASSVGEEVGIVGSYIAFDYPVRPMMAYALSCHIGDAPYYMGIRAEIDTLIYARVESTGQPVPIGYDGADAGRTVFIEPIST